MKAVVLAMAFILLFLPISRADQYTLTEKTDTFSVEVIFDRGQPVRGKNHVRISIMDLNANPAMSAQVKLNYFMPSLPHKSPMMESTTTANPFDHKYEAILEFTMRGLWKMTMFITTESFLEKVNFTFQVK